MLEQGCSTSANRMKYYTQPNYIYIDLSSIKENKRCAKVNLKNTLMFGQHLIQKKTMLL